MSMETDPVLEPDFEEFVQLLIKHDVRFMIVGEFAMGAHGWPRYCNDFDIWAEPSEDNAERILQALKDFVANYQYFNKADFIEDMAGYTLGNAPITIRLLPSLAGLDFEKSYQQRYNVSVGGQLQLPFIGIDAFLITKATSATLQDLADLEILIKIKVKFLSRSLLSFFNSYCQSRNFLISLET